MMPPRRRSLIAIVSWRLVAFTVLAMLLELCIVYVQYRSDASELGRSMIGEETENLARGVSVIDGKLAFSLTQDMRDRYLLGNSTIDGGIFIRVHTGGGTVLFSNCAQDCEDHFLPVEIDPPTFWQRDIAEGMPLSVAGGRSFDVDGQQVVIEMAILKDPNRFLNTVLFHELRDHLIIPMPLMFGLVAGATILSVWAALKPVVAAGRAADTIDPRSSLQHLSTEGMPREAATFVNAVNRLLTRVDDLIQAQKIFSTSIAHEIRTPVAIVRMELERIKDPRARKAEKDLDALTHMLEQLTSLAKLDIVDPASFRTLDLNDIAGDSVEALAPFVFANGHTLELSCEGNASIRAVPALIENTIANLVQNAVRHTPAGTHITVRTHPGRVLEVCDDGPGFAAVQSRHLDTGRIKSSDALGVGLKIVERIADLHGAKLSIGAGASGGSRIAIEFPVLPA